MQHYNVFIVLISSLICHSYQHYTNYYAVHIKGGTETARQIVEKHGFTFVDQIMPDYYHIRHDRVVKRSLQRDDIHVSSLENDSHVLWIEQQISKHRVKRDLTEFNDPQWPKEWYLNRGNGLDMNVLEAYQYQMTGNGIVVSILDDGIEKDHPDLIKNYDAGASYDVNGHDNDPQPRYDFSNENRHGTRCAGEVAAEANNNICNVGVAYNARIGGVRMLDGEVTDAVEAQSISLNQQHIDIYSASWGPDDDGRTVDGPGPLARQAFHSGITS
jgi:furin